MKTKISSLFLFIISIWLLCFSCFNTCPECPKDIKIWDCLDKSIPYQKGNTTVFTNSISDTLIFHCNDRFIFETTHAPFGAREEECCTLYSAENLQCTLNSGDNDKLSISTFKIGDGPYEINVLLKIDTIEEKVNWLFYESCTNYEFDRTLDLVQIANETFNNVGEIESTNQNILFYWSLENSGLVGFIINNEEWALLQ